MGLTQNLGRLSPSIFSDASLNIGVGAAPSGSYKFEVTGTSKVSGVLTLGATLSNGTYTYTLPAATGTLALTSDIPSLTGYVPYTGATANVNLGVYNLAGGNVNINGGGSGGGALRLKQFASSEANLEGYNSISTLTSGVFYFTSSASVPNFKNFVLNPSGLTDNTLRTYALPDASGTLALTSDLGAYLPLTGGTLTGTLNGTNAFFSNNVRTDVGLGIKYGSFVSTSGYLNLFSALGGGSMTLNLKDGTGGYESAISFSSSANRSYTFPNANGTIALTSDLSSYLPLAGGTLTGALGGTSASFSSYVESIGFRATSSSAFGGTGVGVEIGYSGGLGYVQAYNRGTSLYQPMKVDGSTISLQISGVEKLGIASTGAATFSGPTVTIGSAVAATNVKLLLNGVASKAAGIEFQQSGTSQWYIGNGIASEDNNFELYNSNGTMAMKIIKSTNAINFIGAATFSSSITANSNSTINGSGVDTLRVNTSGGTNTVQFTSTGGAASRLISILSKVEENSCNIDFRAHGSTYGPETLFSNSCTNAVMVLAQPAGGAVFCIGNYNSGDMVLGTSNTERVRISSAGSVAKPYQPFVIGGLDGNQSISALTFTTLNFSTSVGMFYYANVGSCWNNATRTFTAPVTGVYMINVSLMTDCLGQLALFVNGVRKQSIPQPPFSGSVTWGGTAMIPLSVGEGLTLQGYGSAGTVTQNQYHTWFAIYLLG